MKLSVGGDDSVQNEFGQLLSNFPQAQVHNRKQKKRQFFWKWTYGRFQREMETIHTDAVMDYLLSHSEGTKGHLI